MSIKHPLDEVFNMDSDDFDIEKEYSMVEEPKPGVPVASTEPVPDPKDEDDKLVEERIDEVYTEAMEAFRNQSAYTEVIEPRFAARNAEVAANYLNIALQAANSRAKVKSDRKRANQTFVPYSNQGNGKTTNNVIIANREEILKMISIDSDKKPVE